MRMSTFVRGGAAVTASALALSLGTGPATAADHSPRVRGVAAADTAGVAPHVRTSDGTAGWSSSSAARRVPGVNAVDSISVEAGYLFRKGGNAVDIEIVGDSGTSTGGAPVEKAAVTVRINGKDRTNVPVYYYDGDDQDPDTGTLYFESLSGWGAGKSQILSTTVTYTDGETSTDETNSNTFYIRSVLRFSSPAVIYTNYTPGTKIKFQPKGWKVFKPSTGTYVSLGSIRLQYRKSGAWKTLKVIKLSSSGSGSYTYSAPTRTYRLYVPTSTTVFGASTGSFRS